MKKSNRKIQKLTVEDKIKASIVDIKEVVATGDYEAAHSMEDELLRFALRSIAGGKTSFPRTCAKMALSVTRLRHPRYCS